MEQTHSVIKKNFFSIYHCKNFYEYLRATAINCITTNDKLIHKNGLMCLTFIL